MLLKGGVGIISETVTGIETVHDEIIQNDSKNLSDKGKAFLLYLCFVIMLLLIACQEWLSSVVTRFVDVSGYKDLVIIVIVIIWSIQNSLSIWLMITGNRSIRSSNGFFSLW